MACQTREKRAEEVVAPPWALIFKLKAEKSEYLNYKPKKSKYLSYKLKEKLLT